MLDFKKGFSINIILYGLLLFSILGVSQRKDHQEENITFEIDSIDASKIKWLDSFIVATPQKTIMSRMYGDNPFDNKYTPWCPSSRLSWNLYFPYSDTLFLKVSDISGKIVCEPLKYFISKGCHQLKGDSRSIKKGGVYQVTAAFCDSTFKRPFIVLE